MSGFHPFGGRVSRHFGDNLSPDDAYLSYYDIRLTKEDVDCIKNDWLTDNIEAIAFWEEFLEHERLKDFPKAHIILLRPSMSFMLRQTQDPQTLKEALPDFSQTTHIFLPVNDNRDPTVAEGGSHWSLLLVSVIDGIAFHYDSLRPTNRNEATTSTQKLGILLGRPLRFIDLTESPQQENSSDCGVFVCLQMQYLLLRKLLTVQSSKQVNMSMGGKDVDAVAGRKEMLKIIEERRKEGERRRSRSSSPFSVKDKSKSPPRIGQENESNEKK
ncbi:MAG: hypothetical protein M1820_008443 [Bogoriella megaspora]|nr:MAG: hypothetical protein M1820_008443 [Bogoriella megaspora]